MFKITKLKVNPKKGILFWVTGISGAGKTTISKKLLPLIIKKYGPTIEISGDNIRQIFDLKKYDDISRKKYAMFYSKLCKQITDKKINVIFSTISFFKSVRNWNKENINNYVEIYVSANLNKILKFGKKSKIYKNNNFNIVGKDIKGDYPKKPHIKIKNNFNESLDNISIKIYKKINEIIKEK